MIIDETINLDLTVCYKVGLTDKPHDVNVTFKPDLGLEVLKNGTKVTQDTFTNLDGCTPNPTRYSVRATNFTNPEMEAKIQISLSAEDKHYDLTTQTIKLTQK
jgi:hypothetical protein